MCVQEETQRLPLAGIELPDVRDGHAVHLGELPGRAVLTLIRHRF